MIVLLSSAARPRYADDIIRALALPIGGQMQFRYNKNWVEPALLDRIPREQLADAPILICFLAGNGRQRPFRIIPIRFARLIRGEIIGSSCIFIFEVGQFVGELAEEQVRAVAAEATRARLPSPAPANDAYFVFEAGLARPYPSSALNIASFEATVDRLRIHPPFTSERAAFFTIFRLSEIPERSWFGTWPRGRTMYMGAYRLRGGRRYECEVYCLRPNDPPIGTEPSSLVLGVRANDQMISFASATWGEVDSKYDVKRFIFFSEPTALRRASSMRVFLARSGQIDAEITRDVSLPIVLAGSAILGPWRVLLAAIGTAGPAMVAADAVGKLNDWKTIALMLGLALFAGIAMILPALRKP